MTALDVIVLAVLAGAAISGFMRGFVHEVLALIAWLLVLVAIRALHAPVTGWLDPYVGTTSGAAVAGFLVVAIPVWLIGHWAARSIGQRTRSSILGPIDRVLGFGFGLLKGLAIMALLYLLILMAHETIYGADVNKPEWIETSRTYPLLNASGEALSAYIAEGRSFADGKAEEGDAETPERAKDGGTIGD